MNVSFKEQPFIITTILRVISLPRAPLPSFQAFTPGRIAPSNLGSQVLPKYTPDNLFNLLGPTYEIVAYTQNLYADTLIRQFSASLDRHIPLNSYTLAGTTFYDRLTQKDSYYALSSFDEFLFDKDEKSGSLFLSAIGELINTLNLRRAEKAHGDQYPDGFPQMQETNLAFTLEQAVDGMIHSMDQWQAPFLAYLHFMPPHAPYRPRRDFQDHFIDGWNPVKKPIHPLSRGIDQELSTTSAWSTISSSPTWMRRWAKSWITWKKPEDLMTRM